MIKNSTKIMVQRITPIAFIVFVVVMLGYYAIYLNKIYYSAYGPFYDSMSYMNQLAIIMGAASSDGFIEAIRLGAKGSTVFFPWFEGAILGIFVNPAREYGVLVQLPLVMVQAIAGYIYFKKVPCYSNVVSVAFSIVLISFAAMFFYNGGLSDLRMDLSQALAFGSALAFFSVAHKCRESRYWILFGVMLGISFLVRATTPVYAFLVFGTCAFVDAFISRGNIKVWLHPYLLGVGVAILISLWFFILNFNELYYYYFVWNFDANAALPLSQSLEHINVLLFMNIGMPICILMAAVFLLESFAQCSDRKLININVNWVMLLGGSVPVGFLVFFGAALNPFVSMASIPGLIMFGLAPFISAPSSTLSNARKILYVSGSCIVIGITAMHGVENHKIIASPWVSSITGVEKVTSAMSSDMAQLGKKTLTFEVTYVGSLDSMAIMNSFIYDQGFMLDAKQRAGKNGVYVTAIQPGLANPVEWKAIEGNQPEDKLHTLVNQAVASADYVIMPDDGTTFVPHLAISPYALEFRNLLLKSGLFTKITGSIGISSMETVSVYRNNSIHIK